ncbi:MULTISPECIES: TetR/AcrR family transcriptional regulator [Sphingobium]|uniref:TetR/AcrR family transcriptional regulator n=1 Tax=Sphingobium sp. MI1205 TaxID=407020 RepID=UPI000770249F|nr:TetR/AcrR family transcriptional regulator [Sphingobium sp. MI1205]AMK19944.1 TetR family transcriptional regulator [Sphingobium sp. MI1205]
MGYYTAIVPKSLAFHREDFPDPFHAVPLARKQMACANQRLRRAEILCNVRRLLAQDGYAGVSLKEVAQSSNVSIQTVYNLVGNRTTLLAEAVVEHIGAHGKLAFSRKGYPNPIIGLCDLYWEGAALHPQYTRNATLTYFPPDRPLFEHIHKRGALLLREGFRVMAAEGKLRPCDHQALSSRIAGLQSITVLDGLTGFGDLFDLRRELVNSIGLMLMPVVTGQHAADMEVWLNAFDPRAINTPIGE